MNAPQFEFVWQFLMSRMKLYDFGITYADKILIKYHDNDAVPTVSQVTWC